MGTISIAKWEAPTVRSTSVQGQKRGFISERKGLERARCGEWDETMQGSWWGNRSENVFFFCLFCFSFFPFIFISWRLITLQYYSGFCHTLTWISHGVTCVPHPNPPSHLPLHPLPLGLPSAPGLSTCLMHPTWAGDLFHPR